MSWFLTKVMAAGCIAFIKLPLDQAERWASLLASCNIAVPLDGVGARMYGAELMNM